MNYDLTYLTTGSSEKEWNEEKGVNEPQVEGTGLQPVTIASETGKVTEIKDNKTSWYNYKTTGKDGTVDPKTWANAISKGTSEDYNSYWVWIPRFAYKLTRTSNNGGEIEIVFLKGTTDNPASTTSKGTSTAGITIKRASEVGEDDDSEVYIVHPAFTNESGNGYANGGWDREIPGFWMAKFEAGYVGDYSDIDGKAKDSPVKYSTIMGWSGVTSEEVSNYYYGTRTAEITKIKWPTFQGCRPSMNYIGISDAYELCRQIGNGNADNNPYNLANVDSHMIKNSEWGAVAYLSYSDYGRGNTTEITINNISADGSNTIWAVTGYAGDEVSAAENTIENLDKYINPNNSDAPQGIWYSSRGQKASTTGNTSGVYDMVGGLWEWTPSYIPCESDSFITWSGKLSEEDEGNSSKYKSKYEGGKGENQDYANEENKKRKGEAIWETSSVANTQTPSWNDDYSLFMSTDGSAFMRRGGECSQGKRSGVFAFTRSPGYCENKGRFPSGSYM